MYRVLIVEDETIFQRVLKKIIESMEDYKVIGIIDNGLDVMEFCDREHPDFICMDILLPGENGISVSKKIKKKYPSTVIFILSAYQDFSMVQTAMSAGLDAYMTKPYNPDEIKNAFYKSQALFEKKNYEKSTITSIMQKKEILPAFEVCKELVEKIFHLYEKDKERYIEIKKIVDYCIDYLEMLSVSNREYYEKKYEIPTGIEKYACVSEAFFHLLTQEIYRLQLLSKYPQFNVILSYIHKNIDKDVTLNEISELCNMSQGYITRIFKRYYGIGVVSYAHLIKIIWAKLYLACSELSISDISYSLGYNDPGYFGKVFKKYEGVTPSVYKRENDCQGYNITGGFGKLGGRDV